MTGTLIIAVVALVISILALALSAYNYIKTAKVKGNKITDSKGKDLYEKI